MTPGAQGSEASTMVAPRDRILDAGLELFTSRGFRDVTAAELAAAAEVSVGELESCFASTYAVLERLYHDITSDVVNNVLAALDEAPPGLVEHLYCGMRAYLHTMLDDPRRTLLVGVEVLGVDRRLDAERRDARVLFAEFFAQLATTYEDQGIIPKGLTSLSYMALSAAIFEMACAYALTPAELRPTFEALTEECVHFFKAVIVTPLL